MSQCHKLKIIIKHLIISRLEENRNDAVSHYNDDFSKLTPYGKGRIRV